MAPYARVDNAGMYLRERTRKKNGKIHRYWSVVESRRLPSGKTVQKHVLYLGELNDVQHAGWVKSIEALAEDGAASGFQQMALFPDDRETFPDLEVPIVRIRINEMTMHRPRQYGACWLAMHLWQRLDLDAFWRPRLRSCREGTRWLSVLKTLVAYRLIAPGSEWRLHRHWFDNSAMMDLLNEDVSLAQKDRLYRCLDHLLEHRDDFFGFLKPRWADLFGESYDVILYDLTSTYFESDPPENRSQSKKRFGYSRDRRSDCVQVVIALVVTPNGFPLAYEIYPGNTNDTSTLKDFLGRIEAQYGKTGRIWLMDRGIPTEATLEQMRNDGGYYLVGTPKGRLSKLEKSLLRLPWTEARESVRVKLLPEDGEFYVYVESQDRLAKERSMRRRRLKRLWKRLHQLQQMKRQTRDDLLMRLGAAKKAAGRAWSLVTVNVPEKNQEVNEDTFTFSLNLDNLRQARRREGRYLLRSNMTCEHPERVWEQYLLLTQVEQAFKDLKGDLAIRPIYHRKEPRIEAHIFVAFIAYCLQITLRNIGRQHGVGLTARTILEKFEAVQMIDVQLPTTDDRCIKLSRHTEPDDELKLLMERLRLELPAPPPPKFTSAKPL
jgi:transposase